MDVDEPTRQWLVELRRQFHRFPELANEEHGTQKAIIAILGDLGIEAREIAGTGVIARIEGDSSGRTIALRADMDALAIQEAETELNPEYISTKDGIMHACGHDGHMATVVGAAKLLNERRASLEGSVVLIFQPSEESPPGGALPVIQEGGLEGVDAILGLHIMGDVRSGEVRFRAGPFMAHHCSYELEVVGKSGHHMNPDQCIDPIAIASRFVATVQRDVKERLPPTSNFVLGFGKVAGGTENNQTPDSVSLTGTFRSFSEEDADEIERTMRANLDGLMEAFRKEKGEDLPRYDLEVRSGYPVLVNDPRFARRAVTVLSECLSKVDAESDLNFGAEDFAYYLKEVPGLYLFLGTRNPGKGIVSVNHSSRFDIDEEVLLLGVEVLTTLVLDYLSNVDEYA